MDAPNEAFLLVRGVGTQNYICQPSCSIGQVDCTLFTPQATLFTDQGQRLTTHFFGPNPSPFENGVVRAALAGLAGHEHGLGSGE